MTGPALLSHRAAVGRDTFAVGSSPFFVIIRNIISRHFHYVEVWFSVGFSFLECFYHDSITRRVAQQGLRPPYDRHSKMSRNCFAFPGCSSLLVRSWMFPRGIIFEAAIFFIIIIIISSSSSSSSSSNSSSSSCNSSSSSSRCSVIIIGTVVLEIMEWFRY